MPPDMVTLSAGCETTCSGEPNNKEWIQFDFSQERIIYGVVTRGRADYAQWVTSYKMLYSSDASEERTWTTFRDVIGDEMVFTGNSDQNTLQVNTLWQPISARYVRLMPLSAYQDSNLCMRADVIGCVDA
ncbi:hypothetical protein LSAT2_005229 [Lamellibrachia satsuma]|nr:hypothetical protein LSAT2_005229 [Lamellibrachia satsuma]